MDSDNRERGGGFLPYPTNRVVGTIDDARSTRAAIEALSQAGFASADIDVLHGEEDLHRLDPTGTEHGFLARFQRTLIRVGAPVEEYKHLRRHVDDVRAGRFVILVLAKERAQRDVAAEILNAHGAEFIGFYGRWAWEGLPVDVDAREGVEFASGPEQIPALFARAWNARDPDALAALFAEDAEFVNVTGLWWHDRASIRRAHAYGLERIFNHSTLAVEETTVKQLTDDIAVVHARMMLTGQTPLGPVKQPGSRANVFSFVVRRTGSEWQCVSAHNTDVVRNMETNIIDEDGRFRSANYRTGQVS